MLKIRCHFDGKTLIPEEPVNLRRGEEVVAHIERAVAPVDPHQSSALEWLFDQAVDDPALPEDLGYQHDHYLYGTAKKP